MGAGAAARESFWRTQLPPTSFQGNTPSLISGWMSFLLLKICSLCGLKYIPAFDQIFLERRATTQRPTPGQEKGSGRQIPPTLPSLPLSELTIICVLAAAQRKSSISGDRGFLQASHRNGARAGTALRIGELLPLQTSPWSRSTDWRTPFTPSFALETGYGLVSSFYTILARTELRESSSRTICTRSFDSFDSRTTSLI